MRPSHALIAARPKNWCAGSPPIATQILLPWPDSASPIVPWSNEATEIYPLPMVRESSASPDQIAAALRMFGYRRPGVLVEPDFTPQITDRLSGQVLYHAQSRTLLNVKRTASDVGAALELKRRRSGTIKAELHDLSRLGVRSKTGTPHTIRNGVPVGRRRRFLRRSRQELRRSGQVATSDQTATFPWMVRLVAVRFTTSCRRSTTSKSPLAEKEKA